MKAIIIDDKSTPYIYIKTKVDKETAKILKNIAQKITNNPNVRIVVNSKFFEAIVNYFAKNEDIDEVKKKLLKTIAENNKIFKVEFYNYKNHFSVGYFNKLNAETFSDIKKKIFVIIVFKKKGKIAKDFIIRELDGTLNFVAFYEKTVNDFLRIVKSGYGKVLDKETLKGIERVCLNSIKSLIKKQVSGIKSSGDSGAPENTEKEL